MGLIFYGEGQIVNFLTMGIAFYGNRQIRVSKILKAKSQDPG